jgi:hypothetical protein
MCILAFQGMDGGRCGVYGAGLQRRELDMNKTLRWGVIGARPRAPNRSDPVYVPLPNQTHFAWSVCAVESGEHMRCEKQFLDPTDALDHPAADCGSLHDLGSYAISPCNLVFKRSPTSVVSVPDRDLVLDGPQPLLPDAAGLKEAST